MRIRKITRESHPYPHFFTALLAFGKSSPEIARALGGSQRSAAVYLSGEGLPRVEVVKRHPTIDAALTLDLAPPPPRRGVATAKAGPSMRRAARPEAAARCSAPGAARRSARARVRTPNRGAG